MSTHSYIKAEKIYSSINMYINKNKLQNEINDYGLFN